MTEQDVTLLVIAACFLVIGIAIGRWSRDWKRL